MIAISHLYKTFVAHEHVLRNLQLDVEMGEFVFLMGSSGAGKTTLFRIMTGFEKASSGRVHINGFNVAQLTNRQMALFPP